MKKVSMKEKMVEVVKVNGVEVNGVYEVERSKYETLVKEVEALEKFTIKNNKKDENLKAIAYTSKKSENLVLIRIIEDKVEEVKIKKISKKSSSVFLKIKTEMLKDSGINYHKCLVTMRVAKTLQDNGEFNLDRFLDTANKIINEEEILESATFEGETKINEDEDSITYKNIICFPKIPKHSKDGYAKYKTCLTQAKKQIKVAL